MNDKIIAILNYYWEQVAGSQEFDAVLNSNCCYIKITSIENGMIKGLGLWGSQAKNWSVNFGEDYSQLEFDCGCPQIKVRSKSDCRVPCSHCIRAILTLESKITGESYETVYDRRFSNVVPF